MLAGLTLLKLRDFTIGIGTVIGCAPKALVWSGTVRSSSSLI
jgi:hypothetical protein